VIAALLAGLLVACGNPVAVPGVVTATMNDGTEDPLATPIAELPAFALRTQADQPFGREQFLGKVTVVNFIFTTCPDICPMLSAEMAEITGHYTNEPGVQFVSISVDPATDTPAVLAAYGARFGADPARWRFLTGDFAAVRVVVVDGFKSVLEKLPATDVKPASVLHGERFVLVDKQARIRLYPDTKEPGKKALHDGVARLLKE
jgi:protein SCO1/2